LSLASQQITGVENNTCINCVLCTDDVIIMASSSKKFMHASGIKCPTKRILWTF